MNYDDETREFVSHGMSIYNVSMLAETEAGHCAALFSFAKLDGWLDGKTVVDVGCGVGGLLSAMRSSYPNNEFIGLTNSRAQQQIAAQSGLDVRHGDMDSMEFPDADLFVFTESLGHARSIPNVIAECSRRLRPDGRVLFKDFNVSSPQIAATWGYKVVPLEVLIAYGLESGLRLERFDHPRVDYSRYLDYWRSSEYMKRIHGEPYAMNGRTSLAMFAKA